MACTYFTDKLQLSAYRLEDYDVEEEDEEALIEQRRLQRLAIVEVRLNFLSSLALCVVNDTCYILIGLQNKLKVSLSFT